MHSMEQPSLRAYCQWINPLASELILFLFQISRKINYIYMHFTKLQNKTLFLQLTYIQDNLGTKIYNYMKRPSDCKPKKSFKEHWIPLEWH